MSICGLAPSKVLNFQVPFSKLYCSIKSQSFNSIHQVVTELSSVLEKDLDTTLRKLIDQGMRQMNKQIISVQHGKCNDRITYKATLSSFPSHGVTVWRESQTLTGKLHK